MGNELPFVGYNFETRDVSGVVATPEQKRRKVGGEILLQVPSLELVGLQTSSYASVKSCEIEWRWLNGEIDEVDGPDGDFRETESLVLLVPRDAGWEQEIGTVDLVVANLGGRGCLKSELTRVQLAVQTIVEMGLDVCREVLVSCYNLRQCLAAAEGKVAQDVEERGKLGTELCNLKLRL